MIKQGLLDNAFRRSHGFLFAAVQNKFVVTEFSQRCALKSGKRVFFRCGSGIKQRNKLFGFTGIGGAKQNILTEIQFGGLTAAFGINCNGQSIFLGYIDCVFRRKNAG